MLNTRRNRPRPLRSGLLMTEVLVAAVVLVAVISVLTQLMIRGGRLQMDARRYQVALDELSNQIDRLTALNEDARNRALQALTPSPDAAATLPSAKLQAKTINDAAGHRLVLSLAWDRFGERRPITLVGWLPPASVTPDERAGGPSR